MADGEPRRSLILAGGGSKVAFQAGVLQVWLDEAELEFDHVDAASGGVLNLVMMCQGLSGTQIADNWRAYQPLAAIDPDLAQWLVLPFARSLFRFDRFRKNVLGRWGLDWNAIRGTQCPATFNLYDFTNHRHEVVEPADMNEDRLISAISLPMWFPPVRIEDHTFIDAVFITDGNLEEAVRRGADEIWVIWTVSRRGGWARGLVSHYFQMIEAMANAQFDAIRRRIEESNRAIARGEQGEFGRPIAVKVLAAEVPLHYLLNFTHDRVRAAVELGVQAGRRFCADEGTDLFARGDEPPSRNRRGIRFRESMSGWVAFGESDYELGSARGRADGTGFEVRLEIAIDDLDRFVVMPDHRAAAGGSVVSDAFGGELPVEQGSFNLFVEQDHPGDKRMLYQLWFRDGSGRPLTVAGHKVVRNDPGPDLWRDTTSLFTHVLDGHVPESHRHDATVVASGMIRISMTQFARQLTTFRVDAPSALDKLHALARFGRLFTGGLWDVYGREVVYDDR